MASVSYIIPAYNSARYIKRCIESALAQKHHEQIIIIDDGSTDDTRKIIQSFHNPEIEVIVHKKNQGCCVSRMDGLRQARCDYVTFIDSDDYYIDQLPVPLLPVFDIIEYAMFGAFNASESPNVIAHKGKRCYFGRKIWQKYTETNISQLLVNKLVSKRIYQKFSNALDLKNLSNYSDNLCIASCYAHFGKSFKSSRKLCYFYRQKSGMNTKTTILNQFKQLCDQIDALPHLEKLHIDTTPLERQIVERAQKYLLWIESSLKSQKNGRPLAPTTMLYIGDDEKGRAYLEQKLSALLAKYH